MPISADDLLLFVAIARAGSLIRASASLGIPKATVSRRLSRLESDLGQQLLVRTTRRIHLTEFGATFLEQCQRVSDEVAAAGDFARSREILPRGRLRVSMPQEYLQHQLRHAVISFSQQYPDVQLEMDLSSRYVDVPGERYDLAIRMGTLSDDSTLVARRIDTLSFGLYASPLYLALHALPLTPADLAHHHAVRLLSPRGTAQPWKLTQGRKTWEQVPPGTLTLNALGVLQQLVLDGAGIGALPERYVTPEVAAGRLVRLLPDWQLPAVPAWAITPTRRYLPAKTRAFIAHVQDILKTP